MRDPWMELGLDNCLMAKEGDRLHFARTTPEVMAWMRQTLGLPANRFSGLHEPMIVDKLTVSETHMIEVEKSGTSLKMHLSTFVWEGHKPIDAFVEYCWKMLETIEKKCSRVYVWAEEDKFKTIDNKSWKELDQAVIHAVELSGRPMTDEERYTIMDEVSREMKNRNNYGPTKDSMTLIDGGIMDEASKIELENLRKAAEEFAEKRMAKKAPAPAAPKPDNEKAMPCWGGGLSYPAAHCAPPVGDKTDGHACEGCTLRKVQAQKKESAPSQERVKNVEKAIKSLEKSSPAPTEITDMTLDHVALTPEGPKAGISVKAKKGKRLEKCHSCAGQGYLFITSHLLSGQEIQTIERCDACGELNNDSEAFVMAASEKQQSILEGHLGIRIPDCPGLPRYIVKDDNLECANMGDACPICIGNYMESAIKEKIAKWNAEHPKSELKNANSIKLDIELPPMPKPKEEFNIKKEDLEFKGMLPELYEMEKKDFWMCDCKTGENVKPVAMVWCEKCKAKRDNSPAAKDMLLNHDQTLIRLGKNKDINFPDWNEDSLLEFIQEVATGIAPPLDSTLLTAELVGYGMDVEQARTLVNKAWRDESILFGIDSSKLYVTMVGEKCYEIPPQRRPCCDCREPTDAPHGRCNICQELFIEDMKAEGKEPIQCKNCELIIDPEADDIHRSPIVTSIRESGLCLKCRALSNEPKEEEVPKSAAPAAPKPEKEKSLKDLADMLE